MTSRKTGKGGEDATERFAREALEVEQRRRGPHPDDPKVVDRRPKIGDPGGIDEALAEE